jgi:hypothetical protein
MVFNNSNKSYAIIITGVLLMIVVVAIFGIIILGVLGIKNFSDGSVQLSTSKMLYISESNDSQNNMNHDKGNDNLVSGSKRGCDVVDIETVPGSIAVDWTIDPYYELPLCIKEQADLDGLNAALDYRLTICGGYLPLAESYIDVWQKAYACADYQVIKGTIGIEWENLGHPADAVCCCENEWKAYFVYKEDICLISSQLPDEDGIPSCMDLDIISRPTCKEVDFEFNIAYKGCHFWTIPASDLHFPEFPTPDK